MKPNLKKVLALVGCTTVLAGGMVFASACGHTHDYTARSEVVKEATCLEAGTERHYCECGEYQDTSIAATGEHDYEYSESESKPATCAEDGKRVEVCSVCGDRKEEKLPHLEHNFSDEWVTVKPATAIAAGEEQRKCQNAGCTEAETRPIEKLEAKNYYNFTVNVVRSTGGAFNNSRGAKIVVKDIAGNVAGTSSQMRETFRVPEGEYTVTMESLPKGYVMAEGDYTVTETTDLTVPVCVAPLPGEELTDKTSLGTGSVLYDVELEVIELKAEDDYTTTFSELLTKYKCIYIDLYFKTCPYCLQEIDEYVNIFNAKSETGKTYGEEVAFIMLGQAGSETKTTIRQFKKNPNSYMQGDVEARDLPWMMVYCPKLERAFARNGAMTGYPTSIFVDSEGLITRFQSGYQSMASFFTNQFDVNIRNWYKAHGETMPGADADAIVPAPVALTSDDRRRIG